MRFEEILPAVRAGGKAARKVWAARDWAGCWLELAPSHVLPDGRTLMPQLVIAYPDEDVLRPFAGVNWDILADDWDLLADGPGRS